MKISHYECDSCDSVFDIRLSEEAILAPEFCPFCKEPLGECYEIEHE